ncbi:hypothetical protein ABKN59_009696 [Abortiporus biennis]
MQWKVEVSRRMDEFLVVAFHVLSLFSESSNPSFEITEDRVHVFCSEDIRTILAGLSEATRISSIYQQSSLPGSTPTPFSLKVLLLGERYYISFQFKAFDYLLMVVRVCESLGEACGVGYHDGVFPRNESSPYHDAFPSNRSFRVGLHIGVYRDRILLFLEAVQRNSSICSIVSENLQVCFVLYSPPARIKDVETFSLPSANRQFPFDTASSTLWTWIYWCMGRLL